MKTTDRADAPPEGDEPLGIDRRRKRAFTISLVVMVLVAVVALGYSFVRDPGPQPKYAPTITGTNDGSLKRAIIHYLGALQSGNADEVVKLADSDEYDATAVRQEADAAVADFSGIAHKRAGVHVVASEIGAEQNATITFANGRTERVTFSRSADTGRWSAVPNSDRVNVAPPTPDPGAVATPTVAPTAP